MLKISKVDKYFNKGKKNQIKAIDNTSLEFDKCGMVALLGPSGCGKTTLLNAIGGLDKVNSGDIFINGHAITKGRTGKKDAIRNEYIGYIFQNYNLVEDMTVFDNVAVVLKMLGIKDKDEIDEKVRYVLEKVGMWRYRKRFAAMLSGGERQRVGIARAIVKNPPIIIADEPTGNLDSKNTLEVMNIIKAISKDKLVILVTHEENLANFYATRIIRLRDGNVVSDEINDHENGLDYVMDNRIYLGDMAKKENIQGANTNINIYRNDEEKVDIDIIIKNGNIYIRTDNDKRHMEVVDENSSLEIVDGNYKEMTKEEQALYRFDSEILKHKGKVKFSSTIGFTEMIKNGFSKVLNYPKTKKILLLGFMLSAMFIIFAISNVLGVLTLDESQFVKINRDYLRVENKNISVDKFNSYEKDKNNNYVLPGDSIVKLPIKLNNYYQTSKGAESVQGSLADLSTVDKEQLIKGKMPKNKREILVDTWALDFNFTGEEGTLPQAGFKNKEDVIGQKIDMGPLGRFKIVGITKSDSPSIYMDKIWFNDLISMSTSSSEEEDNTALKFASYNHAKENIKLEKGTTPKEDYEVVVNIKNQYEMPIGSKINGNINGKELKIVGFYSDNNQSDLMLTNDKTVKYSNLASKDGLVISSKNKEKIIEKVSKDQLNIGDSYNISRDKYKTEIEAQMTTMLIMAAVIFLISIIEIYLIMRASFLSRIKEVGVYRAIGMKKIDIYKMFIGEISAITTIGSMPGFVFMCYILYKLTGIGSLADQYMFNLFVVIFGIVVIYGVITTIGSMPGFVFMCYILYKLTGIGSLADQYMFNLFVVIFGIVVIYGVNLIFGLLPVWRTVRKTPAEILARTDI